MSLSGNFGTQANQGPFAGQQELSGLGRKGWQQLIASHTGPGINAAQSAVDLDPFYISQREGGGLREFGPSGRRVGAWQQAIHDVTQQYGVNAAQAAEMLDPYWKARREHQADEPGTQGSGRRRRNRSRSLDRGFGRQSTMIGAANAYNGQESVLGFPTVFGGTPSTGPRGRASGGSGDFPYQQVLLSPQQLGATVQNGQIRGLDRPGYQVLLSQVAGRFGINASQAARLLGPLIQSQKEGRHLTPQEWNQMISQATQQFGVNAAQAAELLDPYVQGAREKNSRFDVTDVTVTPVNPLQGVFGATNTYRRNYGSANRYSGITNTLDGVGTGYAFSRIGKTPVTGLESGLGMYEGQSSPSKSFRGGTPPESTDVVLNDAESAGLAMLQAAQSPARITSRANQNFNEVDIARIARALGIPTQGLTRAAMIAQIRAQTGAMSPRSQAQFLGSQSPRTQQLLRQPLL